MSELRLFGSFARDEAGPESDVDLLVEMDRPMGLEFFAMELELGEKLGRKVDFCSEDAMNRFVLRRALRDEVSV